MKFSFIIPVYRVEDYLQQCVESVLGQTCQDFEMVLVDDGSPDSCPTLCDEWAKKDSRIQVVHKQNGGLSSARNEGLKVAQGEYVIFLDSDDWWCDRTALERIAGKIEETRADVVLFSSKKYYTRDDRYVEAATRHDELSKQGIIPIEDAMRNSLFVACAWDKAIRRSVLVDNHLDFVVGQLSEDIEWCCKLLMLNLKYACVGGIVHVYRQQNASSITSHITNKNLSDIYDVIRKYATVDNVAIRNFLALEMILWMAITDEATGAEGKQLIQDMGKYFCLLKYRLYPRVAIVSKVRFLGYEIVRRMLVWYLSRK